MNMPIITKQKFKKDQSNSMTSNFSFYIRKALEDQKQTDSNQV